MIDTETFSLDQSEAVRFTDKIDNRLTECNSKILLIINVNYRNYKYIAPMGRDQILHRATYASVTSPS